MTTFMLGLTRRRPIQFHWHCTVQQMYLLTRHGTVRRPRTKRYNRLLSGPCFVGLLIATSTLTVLLNYVWLELHVLAKKLKLYLPNSECKKWKVAMVNHWNDVKCISHMAWTLQTGNLKLKSDHQWWLRMIAVCWRSWMCVVDGHNRPVRPNYAEIAVWRFAVWRS